MKRSIRKTVSSGHREDDGRRVDSSGEGCAGKTAGTAAAGEEGLQGSQWLTAMLENSTPEGPRG